MGKKAAHPDDDLSVNLGQSFADGREMYPHGSLNPPIDPNKQEEYLLRQYGGLGRTIENSGA